MSGLLGAVLLGLLSGQAAQAQPAEPVGGIEASRWLPPGSDLSAALGDLPAQPLRSARAGGRLPALARLGELAFRSPQVFGGLARSTGLSCQSCHSNGHRNGRFFVPGLSDRPGSFDPSNALFHPPADDGVHRPLDIPSLRGIAMTAPYGRDGRFASLRAFTRNVMVNEFAGAEPPAWLLDALVAFQRELAFPRAPALGPGGRLTAAAPAEARLGARLFARPFAADPRLSCATCHPPDGDFTDGRLHDVGTGGSFVAPSLRGLADSAPYLHDGRMGSLEAVLARYDRWFALGLSDRERRNLLAYLRVIGAAGEPPRPVTLAGDLDRIAGYMPLLDAAVRREQDARVVFVVRALRQQLSQVFARFPDNDRLQAARHGLIAWSRDLQAVARLVEQGAYEPALEAVAALAQRMRDERAAVTARAAETLYDPGRLSALSSTR